MRVIPVARPLVAIVFAALFGAVQTGCVSVAEHRKLEHEVQQMKHAAGSGSGAQPKQSKRLKKGVITVSGD